MMAWPTNPNLIWMNNVGIQTGNEKVEKANSVIYLRWQRPNHS